MGGINTNGMGLQGVTFAGQEKFPVDTGEVAGSLPQTYATPVFMLGTVTGVLAGAAAVTLPAYVNNTLLTSGSTLANCAVTIPDLNPKMDTTVGSGYVDGAIVGFTSQAAITSLTVTGPNAETVHNAPGNATAGEHIAFQRINGAWWRV